MVCLFGRREPGEIATPKAKPKGEPKKAAPKKVAKKKTK